MVTTKLWAGAGNQCFMVATAIGTAKRFGQPYWVPGRTLDPRTWPVFFTNQPKEPEVFYDYRLYHEPSHGYTQIPFFNNVILEGYFQTERYFNNAREEVLKAFNIPWQPLLQYVSIHVRRGDYLLYPDKHPVVTQDYLREAVELFRDKGWNDFVVTSDDIKYCKMVFKQFPGNYTYSNNKTAVQDLALASCCAHQICSNGSFGWWGAWLNQNPDKTIVMPRVWFGPGNAHLVTNDIYIENAIVI